MRPVPTSPVLAMPPASSLRGGTQGGTWTNRWASARARSSSPSTDRRSGGPGGKSEPVTPYPVLGQGGIVQDDGTCAPIDDFAGPGQGRRCRLVGGPGLAPPSVPVSFWRIGRTGIAAFPVELTKQMGQRIRESLLEASGGALDRVVIAGLTNGYWSYTTTPEEYGYCGYEGSFTLFGREEGYGWLAAGNQLMSALLAGKPAPAGFPEPPDTAFATTATTPIRADAGAGTAVKQPAATVARYGYGVFSWQGGDPQVDAPRGTPFVSLQMKRGDAWQTVATDDTFEDATQRSAGDLWTETFQFDRCRALGTYRFHVTGRALRSAGGVAAPYTVDSRPFDVAPVRIDPGAVSVADGVASVRPLYPDPGSGALIALPRLVRDARVSFVLSDGRVVAADGSDDGSYAARVGSASVSAVRVADDCGNPAALGDGIRDHAGDRDEVDDGCCDHERVEDLVEAEGERPRVRALRRVSGGAQLSTGSRLQQQQRHHDAARVEQLRHRDDRDPADSDVAERRRARAGRRSRRCSSRRRTARRPRRRRAR